MRTHNLIRRSASCLVVLTLLAGCSNTSTVLDRLIGFPHVWVGSDATDAFMIQITKNGNALSGTFDDTSLQSPGSTQVAPLHAAFSGTLDGSALTLSFPEGLGFTTNISGSVSANKMTLQIPQTNGQLVAITLTPGSVDDYNRLVGGVSATASANASASAAAAAAAASAQATQQLEDKIDRAANTVASDVTAVRNADHAPDYSDFDSAIKQANNDLAQARADAAKGATESDKYTACSDAYSAQSDAYSVQSDAYSVQSAMYSLNDVISSANDAVAQLNQDLATYRQAAALMPSYSPPNAPDLSKIQPLLDDIAKQTAAWKAKGDQYQTQVQGLVSQANDVAGQAEKAYC